MFTVVFSRSDLDLDLACSKYESTADRMSAFELVAGWAGGGLGFSRIRLCGLSVVVEI